MGELVGVIKEDKIKEFYSFLYYISNKNNPLVEVKVYFFLKKSDQNEKK